MRIALSAMRMKLSNGAGSNDHRGRAANPEAFAAELAKIFNVLVLVANCEAGSP